MYVLRASRHNCFSIWQQRQKATTKKPSSMTSIARKRHTHPTQSPKSRARIMRTSCIILMPWKKNILKQALSSDPTPLRRLPSNPTTVHTRGPSPGETSLTKTGGALGNPLPSLRGLGLSPGLPSGKKEAQPKMGVSRDGQCLTRGRPQVVKLRSSVQEVSGLRYGSTQVF